MSTALAQSPRAPEREDLFRLTVEQYHTMIEAGVLTEDDPVELLEGVLVQKLPKSRAHVAALSRLNRALAAILPPGYFIQMQDPITLSESEPEPDLAVVRGIEDDFTEHPGPADVALVVEVADTSLRR